MTLEERAAEYFNNSNTANVYKNMADFARIYAKEQIKQMTCPFCGRENLTKK